MSLFESDADAKAIVAYAHQLEKHYGLPLRLVVIDTLARTMAGGDENSNKDMSLFVSRLDYIRENTGAAVAVVHHTGKEKAKGARGSSALPAAIDCELFVDDNRITFGNMRDVETPDAINFRLETAPAGTDAKGRDVASCVVRYRDEGEFDPLPLSRAADRLLASLTAALSDDPEHATASWSEWAAEHMKRLDPAWREGNPEPRGCSPANLRKLRLEIIESGHAHRIAEDRYAFG